MARKGEGQTALITGASMGIGVDLAECFAQDGYDLILTARSGAALRGGRDAALGQRTASRRRRSPATSAPPGGGANLAGGDRGARARGRRPREQRRLRHRRCASTARDRADQLGMIDLNDRALVELTHIYWPRMLANKRGGVLNVASTAAFQPGPLMAIYYASKAFVLSFSEALWKEAEGTGVHVSCLCPGPTVSKFRERAGTGTTRLARAGEPMTLGRGRGAGLRRLAAPTAASSSPARATRSSPGSCPSCRAARFSASCTTCRVPA